MTAQNVTTSDIGQFVRYYRNGWHFGRLLELNQKSAVILNPARGKVSVAIDDVRPGYPIEQ